MTQHKRKAVKVTRQREPAKRKSRVTLEMIRSEIAGLARNSSERFDFLQNQIDGVTSTMAKGFEATWQHLRESDSRNEARFNEIDAKLNLHSMAIKGLEVAVGELQSDVKVLKADVKELKFDVAELKLAVAKNSRDIEQNSRDIAQNSRDIAQNSRDIAQNSRDIAQNSRDIRELKVSIDEVREVLQLNESENVIENLQRRVSTP